MYRSSNWELHVFSPLVLSFLWRTVNLTHCHWGSLTVTQMQTLLTFSLAFHETNGQIWPGKCTSIDYCLVMSKVGRTRLTLSTTVSSSFGAHFGAIYGKWNPLNKRICFSTIYIKSMYFNLSRFLHHIPHSPFHFVPFIPLFKFLI